ncbi:MAG: Rib/alpha-like domain-containing protein [Corynebacterium pyruviciproducens]|uniref:Rib/alpha-like domain-containing protein n=1 Tax=Corynebacterium pyruviciproducens TaxID=598660 RepID=UPI00398353A8
MKLRALSVATCCALASVIVPAGGTGMMAGQGVAPLVAVANAQGFGGLTDATISPGQPLIYSLPSTVKDLRVTEGSQYATFVQTEASDGRGSWHLTFVDEIVPGTYTLGYSWTEAGETRTDSMRVTVKNYALNYKPDKPLILDPGGVVTITPSGYAPAGTKVQFHSTPLEIAGTNTPGEVHLQVPANTHPGEYTVGLTVIYPNHTTQEAEIHLTVASRNIMFPESADIARSQTVWVYASGYIKPWPTEASIRAVPSASAKGLISTEVNGPRVTLKADPQAPLGEHTITFIVKLPGQQPLVREMTVNVTPHEFFRFPERTELHPGALFDLRDIELPEGATMKGDAGSSKYIRVVQRPGRLEIQTAKTIPQGEHKVYFHISYPGQPDTTKVLHLYVTDEDDTPTTQPTSTTTSPTTTTPTAPEPTEPTSPETPGSENSPTETNGVCIEPPAGYAVPLAWAIPLLGLAAVHFPLPGLPQPVVSYQDGLGTNVSMGIGAVLSVIAIASAIAYGVSCYGTPAPQEQ